MDFADSRRVSLRRSSTVDTVRSAGQVLIAAFYQHVNLTIGH
jgi:hypothetical protein